MYCIVQPVLRSLLLQPRALTTTTYLLTCIHTCLSLLRHACIPVAAGSDMFKEASGLNATIELTNRDMPGVNELI